MKSIRYGIDLSGESWVIFSLCDREMMYPVLDFAGMTLENGFAMKYNLENIGEGYDGMHEWCTTRKVPYACKKENREAWGMKPIPFKSGDVVTVSTSKARPFVVTEDIQALVKYVKEATGKPDVVALYTRPIRTWVFGKQPSGKKRIGWALCAYLNGDKPKFKDAKRLEVRNA